MHFLLKILVTVQGKFYLFLINELSKSIKISVKTSKGTKPIKVLKIIRCMAANFRFVSSLCWSGISYTEYRNH